MTDAEKILSLDDILKGFSINSTGQQLTEKQIVQVRLKELEVQKLAPKVARELIEAKEELATAKILIEMAVYTIRFEYMAKNERNKTIDILKKWLQSHKETDDE